MLSLVGDLFWIAAALVLALGFHGIISGLFFFCAGVLVHAALEKFYKLKGW